MAETFDLKQSALDNWITAFTWIPDMTFKQNGTIGVVNPKVPFPNFNLILQSKIKEQDVASAIDYVINKYKEFNLNFNWTVTPFTKPNNFEEDLINNGFQFKFATPHMGILNSDIDDTIFSELEDSKMEIKKVENETLEEYLSTFELGFGMDKIDRKIWYEGFKEFFIRFLENPSFKSNSGLYLGYVDDEPVSTSLGMVSDNVMGIYNISTIPKYRKQGYGGAITIDLMIKGMKQSKGAILQASSMGKPVYEKLGFSTLYEAKVYSLT